MYPKILSVKDGNIIFEPMRLYLDTPQKVYPAARIPADDDDSEDDGDRDEADPDTDNPADDEINWQDSIHLELNNDFDLVYEPDAE